MCLQFSALRAPDFRCGFRGLPLGQPNFLALSRAASALALLVARPACAATTLPMSAPQLGHFSLLMVYPESVNADNYAQHDGYSKPPGKPLVAVSCPPSKPGYSRGVSIISLDALTALKASASAPNCSSLRLL